MKISAIVLAVAACAVAMPARIESIEGELTEADRVKTYSTTPDNEPPFDAPIPTRIDSIDDAIIIARGAARAAARNRKLSLDNYDKIVSLYPHDRTTKSTKQMKSALEDLQDAQDAANSARDIAVKVENIIGKILEDDESQDDISHVSKYVDQAEIDHDDATKIMKVGEVLSEKFMEKKRVRSKDVKHKKASGGGSDRKKSSSRDEGAVDVKINVVVAEDGKKQLMITDPVTGKQVPLVEDIPIHLPVDRDESAPEQVADVPEQQTHEILAPEQVAYGSEQQAPKSPKSEPSSSRSSKKPSKKPESEIQAESSSGSDQQARVNPEPEQAADAPEQQDPKSPKSEPSTPGSDQQARDEPLDASVVAPAESKSMWTIMKENPRRTAIGSAAGLALAAAAIYSIRALMARRRLRAATNATTNSTSIPTTISAPVNVTVAAH